MCSKFERIISTIYYKPCNLFPNHILTGQPRNHGSILESGVIVLFVEEYRPTLQRNKPPIQLVEANFFQRVGRWRREPERPLTCI